MRDLHQIRPRFGVLLYTNALTNPQAFDGIGVNFEKGSGTCLGMEMISPEKDLSSEMRDLVLNKIVELGAIPKSITVAKPEHFIGAITLEKALNIEIKFGVPEHGFKFESGFCEKMELSKVMAIVGLS